MKFKLAFLNDKRSLLNEGHKTPLARNSKVVDILALKMGPCVKETMLESYLVIKFPRLL